MRRSLSALLVAVLVATCGASLLAAQATRADLRTPDQIGEVIGAAYVPATRSWLIADRSAPGVFALNLAAGTATKLTAEGNGPGELRTVYGMGRVGDTIWVYDAARRAYLRYLVQQGKLVGAGQLPLALMVPGQSTVAPSAGRLVCPEPLAMVERGGCLGFVYASNVAISQTPTTGHLVVVFGAAGRIDTLGTIEVPGVEGQRGIIQPFIERQKVAVSSNGRHAVLVKPADDMVVIERFNLLTSARSVLRHSIPLRPLTGRDVSATAAAVARERSEESGIEYKAREVEAQIRRPTTWPRVTAVVVADDGAVWLRVGGHMLWPHARRTEDATVPWQFFGGATSLCGQVMLPSTATIFADNGTDVASVLNDAGVDEGMRIAPRPKTFAPCPK